MNRIFVFHSKKLGEPKIVCNPIYANDEQKFMLKQFF